MLYLGIYFPVSLLAQNTKLVELSLAESIEVAIENNLRLKAANTTNKISKEQVREIRANLLPKIEASGTFTDNLKLPVTTVPGDFFGEPGTNFAVSLGSKFTTTASVNVNQVLYNQAAITALKIARESENISTLEAHQYEEQLIQETSRLYFLSLSTIKQKQLLEQNISRSHQLIEIVKLLVDQGLSTPVDLKRVQIGLQNQRTQLNNVEASVEQNINLLKYMLVIPAENDLVLTDDIDMVLFEYAGDVVNLSSNTNLKILERQVKVQRLTRKQEKESFLPTLSFTGSYAYQGLREDFKDYFSSGSNNKWYANSSIGLHLSLPLFEGMARKSRIAQSQLELHRAQLQLKDTRTKYTIDYKNALNSYLNNQANVETQYDNVTLAEQVYQETTLKYKEGYSSLSDLIQDEVALNNTQSNYLTSLYNLKIAELNILELQGNLQNLLNQ